MLPHNWLHATLPKTLSCGEQVEVPILVEEDFTSTPPPRTIWLSLTYADLTETSQIEVTLNQQPLSELEPIDPWLPPDNTGDTSQQVQVHALRQEISPDLLIQGRNHVGVLVIAGEATMQGVEIHVSY